MTEPQRKMNRVRVWLSEQQEKLRFRKIMTAVIDVEMSSRTGKPERYYYEFYENGHGKRRINVNGSVEAGEYRAWLYNSFWAYAEDWKNHELSTEQLRDIIDAGVKENHASTV